MVYPCAVHHPAPIGGPRGGTVCRGSGAQERPVTAPGTLRPNLSRRLGHGLGPCLDCTLRLCCLNSLPLPPAAPAPLPWAKDSPPKTRADTATATAITIICLAFILLPPCGCNRESFPLPQDRADTVPDRSSKYISLSSLMFNIKIPSRAGWRGADIAPCGADSAPPLNCLPNHTP